MQKLQDGKKIKKFLTRDYLFFVIFGAVLIFSLLLIVPFTSLLKQINQKSVERITTDAENGIWAEADYLIRQSRELDEARVFDRLLANKDSAGLISIGTEEARKRGVGGILVADETGQVLSRTSAISQRGDFIFHSTFWGKEALEKGESHGIEKGVTHPIIIFGAKKLEREGKLFGIIVSAQIPNDDYMKAFAGKYLSKGTRIAFFSKEKGLIGSNFETLEEKRLLETYFSPGSDFNEKDEAQMKVTLNGGGYHARNIVFESGYDGSFGNMILFIPDNYNREAVILAFLMVLFFALAGLVVIRLDKHSHNTVFLILLVLAGSVAIFSLSYFFTKTAYEKERIFLSKPPYLIYNSTIAIDPDSATINLGLEHIISVDIQTGGEGINVVNAVVKYDPSFARVEEIRTTNSFCDPSLFLERKIDNEKGEVRVVCGFLTPGFTELKGTVFELVLQPLKPGRFSLQFGEETAVLANDGLGTNVLRDSTSASYLIAEGGRDGMTDASRVLVFSPSHPNTTRWYNNRSPFFTWSGYDSHKYSYAFDQNPDTEPTSQVLRTETIASFEAEEDGIYYFHLLSKGEDGKSEISHYPVKIDSTPPQVPSIKASAESVTVGEVVRFEFSSKDESSGLQPTFYVKLRDDGVFFPTGPQLFIAFPEKGEQKITVQVFDRANNYSESQKVIKVK